ncbi:MAG: diguanylate cyclase [Synergistaceae bacterium]|nr:diguanylate cyclase [Synergistaceae bacterium]
MEKILILDDGLGQNTLAEALSNDYRVSTYDNKNDVISIAKELLPTIVLLDFIVPQIDGFKVLKGLKDSTETKDIPVIFISALIDPDIEEEGLKLGAADYIHKPFSLGVVKARVKNHIDLFLMRKTIEDLALIDGLTLIPNRRSYDVHSQTEWVRAIREKISISFAMIDIDNFKSYNDYYGHLKGDEILRYVAMTITNSLRRKIDFAARYGGEEFILVLSNTPAEGGKRLSEKICNEVVKLNIPHEHSKVAPVITVSIGGVSVIPKQKEDLNSVVDIADKMLYTAKNEGKNRVVWCDLP